MADLEPVDNIAIDHLPAEEAPQAESNTAIDFSEYMKTFNEIGDHSDKIGAMISQIDIQPYDQDRLREVIKVVKEQHALMNRMYNQLIEMNNVFSDRQ